MQYTKPMIDITMEIRRRVPSSMKPGIKLANPEILAELANYYPECKDTITRTLIKELMHLAKEGWPERLQSPEPIASKGQVKVYRGQVSLESRDSAPKESKRPVRMYRGREVLA
ncbi:MAG TPA: hypothetical protein VIC08_01825 [Cellvibrionaceae bacterium]